jgi:hypothetical protein
MKGIKRRKRQPVHIGKRKLQASFTVEAAFLMPVTILLLIWVISLSIDLYTRVDERAENLERIEKQNSVKEFRRLEAARTLAETLKKA